MVLTTILSTAWYTSQLARVFSAYATFEPYVRTCGRCSLSAQ